MVSKSFLVVACACGCRSETRRDVDDDRGWEYQKVAFSCEHFVVKFDAFTQNIWNPFSSKSDTVRFDLGGTCKICGGDLSTAYSQATSCRTPDHTGTLNCGRCGSRIAWGVYHCAHAGLKTIGWTALAASSGFAVGAVLGPAIAAGVGASAAGTTTAITSGSATLIGNAISGGNAGATVAFDSSKI